MAPKNVRGKTKGDKKKKEEKGIIFGYHIIPTFISSARVTMNMLLICFTVSAVLPVVMDIRVNLPDETHVVLKVCSFCLVETVAY